MKVKPFVFPVLYICLILALILGLYSTSLILKDDSNESLKDVNYVSSVILGDVVPVINVDVTVSNPYVEESVKIASQLFIIIIHICQIQELIIQMQKILK